MKTEKKEKYTLISSEEKSFDAFYKKFKAEQPTFEKEHVIILLADSLKTKNNEIAQFLEYAETKSKNGTSFVIVDKNINIDDFPEEFNIAPTLQEAEDILEMEAIERELGF